MSYPSCCRTWDCRRCSSARPGQIIQQLLEVAPCNIIIPKAVVECPVSQSLRKMSLQRNMGPGIICQPEVAADNVLQQSGGGLFSHHSC